MQHEGADGRRGCLGGGARSGGGYTPNYDEPHIHQKCQMVWSRRPDQTYTRIMSLTVNVQEAKTRLSELLRRAQSGEEILIARAGLPIAKLLSMEERRRDFSRPLIEGFAEFNDAALFEPMDEEELRVWD